MPELEITAAGLEVEHARATCDYLFAVMLWPTECDARTEFLRTRSIVSAIEAAKAAAGIGKATALDLAEQALSAQPPARQLPEIERRSQLGVQVGEFFAAAWQVGEMKEAGYHLRHIARRDGGVEHRVDPLGDLPAPTVSVKQLRGLMTTPARRRLHRAVVGEKTSRMYCVSSGQRRRFGPPITSYSVRGLIRRRPPRAC